MKVFGKDIIHFAFQIILKIIYKDLITTVILFAVVISLMQRQKKRKCEHAIGFKIFKCDQTVKSLDEQYFRYNSSVRKTYINCEEKFYNFNGKVG